ncbi:ATP-dependent DNA ligase LigD phosphoesterase module /ATP-dependent DNA ligase LigD polymerase module [Granulicella rosea]|uniref:DNA ligase (ATP) n=1 Tax=Granulicella rosea TaxID=474952 RepID=A0A239HR48_9BACT|nr:DNA ligase D [Granulicella rosea]SNS83792.1 ATP-dependent DNA ligase LigD phosphoesterase module /ATP-dependent DNA ligase LigD polymerase module [Granulicella rosea]
MAKKAAKKVQSGATAADAVDEQLARYREMRDFSITDEPSGKPNKKSAKDKLPFVIQKHAASHLHYDFRLGWNGVLKSWAVAKGPSYFPGDRRLAVQVEDHPMEYGGFEGIIPQGQYGGGTVMVWDQGTWEPQAGHTDVDAGLKAGSLKFTLHGSKMQGNWTLVRMGGKAANERKPNWLLIKEHDDFERGKDDPCVTDDSPNSVVTGRSLDQIAASEDHVWNSKETAKGNAWVRKDAVVEAVAPPKDSPKEALPEFVEPQLAMQSTRPPADSGWLHELKLDGYRVQVRKDGSKARMLTRSGLDWTHRMKDLAAELSALPCEKALLDGEVVVLAKDGTTSFAELQAHFQEGKKSELVYFAFDLLHLDGRNLRGLPLVERKEMLAALLHGAGEHVRFSEHLDQDGERVFHRACELHAEGIVSKRASGKYVSGRTADWLKHKCVREQELVIGGFTLPSKGTHGVGALLLGYYRDGKLIYAGRAGTGFTQKTHRMMRDRLDALRVAAGAFDKPPAEARRGAIWVKPELVAQVRFATWTADGLVRQASFQGLREDKPAAGVEREEATVAPRPKASHAAPKGIAAKTNDATSDRAPVRLTHADKVLDAESGVTKQQLADFYWAVAERMLPHVAGRPLSLVRCPEGVGSPCFFQKHVNHMLPPGVESVDVPDKKTGKTEPYITLSTAEALAGLAQMGVLEVHPWGSRNDHLEHPDRIVIDLDPDESIPWRALADAALEIRGELKKLELESYLKTTGGKGLHLVVPIKAEHDWAEIKQFAHTFVQMLESQRPELYLTKMSKAARKGRIYLDYLRNERGATAVAAFSPRARPGMAVSLPLSWSELKPAERPVFRVAEFAQWKARLKSDPWKDFAKNTQRLALENMVTT